MSNSPSTLPLFFLAALVLLSAFVFLAGCGNSAEVPDFTAMSADEKEDSLRFLQSGLIGDESAQAAGELMSRAERPRIVQEGFIRDAIDFSVGTIRYFSVDTNAALNQIGALDAAESPLEIVDYGPRGVLPVENSTPRIFVMFNQPMVPVARLGEVMDTSEIMSLDPPVPGVFRWYGSRTLSFEPDVPLLEEPRYRVSVLPAATSLTGETLAEGFDFDIFSERLKIVQVYPGDPQDGFSQLFNVPTSLARRLTLEFNQPVDPDMVAGHIELMLSDESLAFSVQRPEYRSELESRIPRAVQLVLENEPPENSGITIALKAGAVPRSGFPPTLIDQSFTMRTIYPFAARRLTGYSGNFPMDNRPYAYPLYIEFSHGLEEGMDALSLTVSLDGTEVEIQEVQQYFSRLRIFVPDARPGQTVALIPPAGIRDVFGRTLGDSQVLSYTIPRPSASIDFPSHYSGLRHLEAEFDPKIVFSLRNINDFALGIQRTVRGFQTQEPSISLSSYDISELQRDYVRFYEEDLSGYLNSEGFGSVSLAWRAQKDPELVRNARDVTDSDRLTVQVTDLGITARIAYNRVLVWVNRLSDGTAVEGAEVEVFNLQGARFQGQSDSQGLAVIELADGVFQRRFATNFRTRDDDLHILVRKDRDSAEMLTASTHNSYRFNVYRTRDPEDALIPMERVFMFTDRGIYKPGEELAIRGIHWSQDANGFSPATGEFQMYIRHQQSGEEIWRSPVRPSESGGFSTRISLGEDLEPGDYRLYYQYGSERYNTRQLSFYVGNFRRVTFAVETSIVDTELFAGDNIDAAVSAEYLAGGVLASASYDYFWTRRPVNYVPPGTRWQDWSFGTSEWGYERNLTTGRGVLSGSGQTGIQSGTAEQELEGKPYEYTLETRVEDIDRQVVASRASVLVHPADFYIAARFSQGSTTGWWSRFVPTGDQIRAEVRLVNIDGEPVQASAPIEYGLIKGEWKAAQQQGLYGRINTRWEYVEETLYSSSADVVNGEFSYDFTVEDPGRYTLYFTAADERGRMSRTEIPFYATGSGWVQTASQTPSDITMTVDKALYSPGETARILVQSPIPRGRYLLSVEREGILSQEVISLDGSTRVIEVPVLEEYLPVFYVALSSFTERTETQDDYFQPDLGKPRGLFGITSVRVSTEAVELDVEVEGDSDSYGPGDDAGISVRVTRNGEPVAGAEVTILAVDRGVLDLIDYRVPDPVAFFYDERNFPLGVEGDDSRRLLMRPVTYDISTLQGGDSGKMEEREDFNPLALFEPAIFTDQDGYARVDFLLPDSLTSYRVTALALHGNRLGIEEDEILVQNPVNIRTALPRRFRNRDSVAAGVVLTNTTAEDQELTIRVESDILRVAGPAERTITVPANSSYELPFILEAVFEGQGVIRFITQSAVVNEVLHEPVVVERPLITEAFTSIGAVLGDAGGGEEDGEQAPRAVEGLVLPSAIADGYGTLRINVDSSLAPLVRPSADRLLLAPGDTRSFYNSRLFDLAVRAAGYGTPDMSVLRELAENQFESGGIGYRSPRQSFARENIFLSLLTAHVLIMTEDFSVDSGDYIDLDALGRYLLTNLQPRSEGTTVGMIHAWNALLLAKLGLVEAENLEPLEALEDQLGIAGYNLLAEAYLVLGERSAARRLYMRSRNFMNLGTRSVDLRETYEVRGYFDSREAELGLFLRTATLMNESPELLLRIAGTLNASRNSRRFHSPFDDFWTVYGFIPLLAGEDPSDNITATVSVDGANLISREPGFSTVLPLFEAPLADLPRDRMMSLEIEKQGRGQLYYSSTLEYALPGETAQARDEGVELRSQIETLDGELVSGEVLPLGETLRVRVFLSTTRRLSFLTLNVPIPSGAEILDPNLKITGSYDDAGGLQSESWTRETVYGDSQEFLADGYAGYGPGGWWFWFYRPVQRIYDNGISYLWEDFYAGDREVSFLIRTTTPGIYPTPPAQARAEFEPEIFGRSGGRLYIIEGQ